MLKQKENVLYDLLKDHKKNPQANLINQIEAAHLELNVCLTTKAEKSLRWSKAKFYSQADKPGRLLAVKLSLRRPSFSQDTEIRRLLYAQPKVGPTGIFYFLSEPVHEHKHI